MATSASLRMSLRKVPALRFLSRDTMEIIQAQMVCKEYQAGDSLWRARVPLDFLGVIQSGEIRIDYGMNGQIVRSESYLAGDYILPRDLTGTTISARAMTKTKVFVLPVKELEALITNANRRVSLFRQGRFFTRAWSMIVLVLFALITWQDMSRIASGVLFLLAESAPQSQNEIKFLRYAETIDPQATFAYNQEGYIHFQQDNLDGAEFFFEKALNTDMTNAFVLNNLAVTNFIAGQGQQAILHQKNAIQSNPNLAVLQYNLGMILIEQGEFEGALRAFKQAGYIDPGWTLPHIHQAEIHLMQRDFAAAERAAAFAIKLDPSLQAGYILYMDALYQQEKNQEAFETSRKILAMEPANFIAQLYQVLILGRQEEFYAALAILERLKDAPEHAQYVTRIETEIESIERLLQQSSIDAP